MISQQEHKSNLGELIKRDEIDKLLTFEEILDALLSPQVKTCGYQNQVRLRGLKSQIHLNPHRRVSLD
jgi:hypothetical protein